MATASVLRSGAWDPNHSECCGPQRGGKGAMQSTLDRAAAPATSHHSQGPAGRGPAPSCPGGHDHVTQESALTPRTQLPFASFQLSRLSLWNFARPWHYSHLIKNGLASWSRYRALQHLPLGPEGSGAGGSPAPAETEKQACLSSSPLAARACGRAPPLPLNSSPLPLGDPGAGVCARREPPH